MSAPDERKGVEKDAGVAMSLSKGHIAEKDAGHLEALIEKYERRADAESARFCRAQDVVADLRALAMGACDRPDCEPCNTAAARILDDLTRPLSPTEGRA